jgi:putative spermidine/putrescine transport system substrate-binding protein
MYDSNVSRREFLRYLSLTTLGTLGGGILNGCRERPPASAKLTNIRFYGTGTLDILDDGWAVLARDQKVGLVFTDNGNDVGPVIAQMIAGTASRDYHLGGLQGGAERELAGSGVILPWDLKKIPNWATMWPMARSIPYTLVNGEQFGLPLALNADSMIYLPDKIKGVQGYESGVVDSYFAVFDERLRGRTSMEDAWINSVIFTAIYLKENGLKTIGNPGNLTESELREVMTFLMELKRAGQFRKFWRGWEQGVDLLASGEVWVMTGWEPIVYELRRKNVNAEYAVPKEGYEGWSNDLLLHVGTASEGLIEAAHVTANWLFDGYYGCKLATLRGYAVPNDSTTSFAESGHNFDARQVRDLANHVRTKFGTGGGEAYWQNVRPDNYRLYEEWWSRLRNA